MIILFIWVEERVVGRLLIAEINFLHFIKEENKTAKEDK